MMEQETYEQELGEDFARHYLRPVSGKDGQSGGITYYGVPPVRKSDYRFKAAGSFFAEGLAGACQMVSTIVDLLGHPHDRALVRTGRYIAMAGGLVAPMLFIADLHTPSRFFNMLRIFRKTSLMSIGSWSLSNFDAWTAAVASGQALEDAGLPSIGRPLARWCELPAASFGGVVSLYMGTELEETSLPLWARSTPLLPVFFAIGDVANAAAAMEAVAEFSEVPGDTRTRLHALGLCAALSKLVVGLKTRKRWFHEQASSSAEVLLKSVYQAGILGLGLVAPISIRIAQLMTGRRLRSASLVAAGSTLAGGFLLPALALVAGNRSAQDPEEYFQYTKPGSLVDGPVVTAGSIAGLEEVPREGRPGKRAIIFLSVALGFLLAAGAAAAFHRNGGRA